MSFNNALKKVLGLGDYGEGVDDLEYFEKRVYDDPWHKDDDEKKPRTNKDATAQGNEDNADGQQAAQQAKPAYTRVELPRQEVDMTGLANTKGEGVPENILKRFINIINGNLSPHILNHLNVEAETQSIVESLRPQFRDYESNLRKEVLASVADFEVVHTFLREEVHNLLGFAEAHHAVVHMQAENLFRPEYTVQKHECHRGVHAETK